MRADIQQILAGGQSGALLTGGVWGGGAGPQDTDRPYAVWSQRSARPDNALRNGTPCAISRAIEIIVWSSSYAPLRLIESALISDLSEHGYIISISDGWDSDTKTYFLTLDVSIYDTL